MTIFTIKTTEERHFIFSLKNPGAAMGYWIILIALVMSGRPVLADCGPPSLPVVRVKVDFAPPRIETASPSARLGRLAERHGRAEAPGHAALGFALSRWRADFSAPGLVRRAGGRLCGYPGPVELRIGYDENHIYIAREVAADPCLYREVMAHEQRHLRARYAMAARLAPRLKAAVESRLKPLAAFPARDAGEARDRIGAAVDAALRVEAQAALLALRQAQAAIDSDAEYARLAASCGGRLRRLIGW